MWEGEMRLLSKISSEEMLKRVKEGRILLRVIRKEKENRFIYSEKNLNNNGFLREEEEVKIKASEQHTVWSVT